MAGGRLSFWLIAGSIYALYNGLHWSRWQDLAPWTRVHSLIDVCTGLVMLLGGLALMLVRSPWRPAILSGTLAPAVLGVSLIAGTGLGTIPCTGGG